MSKRSTFWTCLLPPKARRVLKTMTKSQESAIRAISAKIDRIKKTDVTFGIEDTGGVGRLAEIFESDPNGDYAKVFEGQLDALVDLFEEDLKRVEALIQEYDLDPKELSRYRDEALEAIYNDAGKIGAYLWQSAFAKRYSL